jgi:hypothetical protein
MNGFTDGTFRANASVPAQQLVAVLMNALGYDVVWNTVLADAAKLGIVAEGAALTRGEAFEAMWYAVSEVKMADSDMTLGQHLGKLAPPVPVVTALAVQGVSATNLREVMITFNNEINEDSLDVENFLLGTTEATKVSLLDAKTVIAVFTMNNQTEYTLTIKSVVDKAKSEVKDYTKKFTVTDFAAPVVEKVTVSGNKKIVVTFSEPVNPATSNILGNYKINGLLFGGLVTTNGREVTIITTARLADGVHTLVVSDNVTDFANFKLVANSNEFVVAKDDVKPAIGTIVSATQTKVKVKFSEPVENTFSVSAASGTFVSKTTEDNLTYTLNFSVLPLSGTEITLTDVTDFYGNKDTLKFNVIPTIDLVRPEVSSVTAKTQTTIEVMFTKDITATTSGGTTPTGTYTLKTVATNPVTKSVTATYGVTDSKTDLSKIILTSATALAAGDYTLEITGAVDTTPLANVQVPYSAKITIADLTRPTVVSATVDVPDATDAGAIYIEFSEKVDAATALDKANYSYTLSDNTPVSLGTANTVSLLGDGKTVKITVPKLATGATAVPDRVTVVNVTDLAGNKVVAVVTPLGAFNAGSVTVTSPIAVAVNKVEVTVPANISLASVTASDFVVKNVTDSITVINAEYDGKTTITLTLNNDLSTNAQYKGAPVSVYLIARNLENVYGTKVAAFVTEQLVAQVTDKIRPVATLASAKFIVTSPTTSNSVIVVNLTENLNLADNATPNADGIVLDINGQLVAPTTIVYNHAVAASGSTPAQAAKLTFTVSSTSNLLGKAYSLKFFSNANAQLIDAASNKVADFTFTGTLSN